jgi:glycosyltransferase involved in cell wall biosynthesis
MRIAMVSEHASPLAVIGGVDAGGQNVHVAALSDALARRGHHVTVYTRRADPAVPDRVTTAGGVVVEHVPAGPPAELPKDELLAYMADFGAYLNRRWALAPPDVVHAHFWMSGLAALTGARRLDVPVLQTYHALGLVKRRHQGARDTSPAVRPRLERAIALTVSRVVATCSDEVFELVRMGVPRRAVRIVPCGVDVGHFCPEGPAWPRGPRHRIVSVGRLVERKGIDTVIRALRSVPDAELLVAGGPEECRLDEDPEVRRLRAVAVAERVDGRVRFVGRVARADVPALLRSADVVACTPWYEPFGIVPLEAMACGVPVVAAAVGGLVDTVVDGITGILVPPRRSDLLAGALRTLLDDPVRSQAYGLAGADRARARYAWDRIAFDTLAVYEETLVRRQPLASEAAR